MAVPQAIPEIILSSTTSIYMKLNMKMKPGLLRICELNLQSDLHAGALCSQFPTAEYVGIAFGRNGTTEAAALPSSVDRASRQCARRRLHVLPPSLYSARAIPAALGLHASCHILIVDMDSPAAAARQTLTFDLPAAFALASATTPVLLILAGHGCDVGNKDGKKGQIVTDGSDVYVNAFNDFRSEQCWLEHAWDRLRGRGHVLPPPSHQINECERIDGRVFCAGELVSADRSLCRPMVKALLDYGSESPSSCGTTHRVIQFPRGLPPDWDVSGRSRPKPLRYRSFDSGVKHGFRHYTLLPCADSQNDSWLEPGRKGTGERQLCLIFKSGGTERWVAGLKSYDAGKTFKGPAELVLPAARNRSAMQGVRMTPNYAMARDRNSGEFVIIGGRYRSPTDIDPGIWKSSGASWKWASTQAQALEYAGRGLFKISPVPAPQNFRYFQLLMSGNHSGCVERQWRLIFSQTVAAAWHMNMCGFRGRLSLVQHRNEWHIYVRAHLGNGLLGVQMTRSRDGKEWSPFRLISIPNLVPPVGFPIFFAAQTNPVHEGSLVALVPVIDHFRACIGLTISVDGLQWSPMVPLVRCAVYGERASHHPVAGGLVRVSKDRVACFINEHVPEIAAEHAVRIDKNTPLELAQWALENTKLISAGKSGHPTSRVVRIEFPCRRLALWTRRALLALPGGAALDKRALYECLPTSAKEAQGCD